MKQIGILEGEIIPETQRKTLDIHTEVDTAVVNILEGKQQNQQQERKNYYFREIQNHKAKLKKNMCKYLLSDLAGEEVYNVGELIRSVGVLIQVDEELSGEVSQGYTREKDGYISTTRGNKTDKEIGDELGIKFLELESTIEVLIDTMSELRGYQIIEIGFRIMKLSHDIRRLENLK